MDVRVTRHFVINGKIVKDNITVYVTAGHNLPEQITDKVVQIWLKQCKATEVFITFRFGEFLPRIYKSHFILGRKDRAIGVHSYFDPYLP